MVMQLLFRQPQQRQCVRPPMPLAPFLPASAQPYPVLLDAYPYPAFIVRTDSTLRPVWTNKAFVSTLGDADVEMKDSFVRVLATAEDGQRYGLWSVEDEEVPRSVRAGKKRCRTEDEEDFAGANPTTVTVRVQLANGEAELELVKSRLENLLIITSTLKQQPSQSANKVSPSKRVRGDKFIGSLAPLPSLRLPADQALLTPERTPVLPSQSPTSSRSSANGSTSHKVQHTLGALVSRPRTTATQTLFDSHAWENTPLGDRSTWSERLRACVNIMQTSPHAVSTTVLSIIHHVTFPRRPHSGGDQSTCSCTTTSIPRQVLPFFHAYSRLIRRPFRSLDTRFEPQFHLSVICR